MSRCLGEGTKLHGTKRPLVSPTKVRKDAEGARAGPAVLVHIGGKNGALQFALEILTLQTYRNGLPVDGSSKFK